MAQNNEETSAPVVSGVAASASVGASAPPIPEYELKSYDPVEFKMPKMAVSAEQVNQKMMEFAERYGAEYVPTNRKVVGAKDDLKMDIVVSKDGEEIPNLSSDDRLYSLGEGLMPIDFDRNVLGMKVGQTKEFDFKAPDFDADGEEGLFHASVTIVKIMRKTVPEITDRWVKKYMPMYKSAEDFRTQVEKGLRDEADRMIEQEKNQRAAHALAERFEGHIDDYFYEQTRADLKASYEAQARSQGLDLQDFIGKQGMDENTFSMMLMFQTREMLTQGFCLDSWARHYGLEATDEDLEELAGMMAPPGRASEMLSHLEKAPEAERKAFDLAALRYVANKDLAAKAKITYVDNPDEL